MKRSGFLAVAALTAFVFAASAASATTWDKNQIKCRAKVAKGAAKVVKAVQKGIGKCFKDSLKTGGTGSNCYIPAGYDAKGKVAKAFGKLVSGAAKCKNTGTAMIAEYGGVCPSPGTPSVLTNLTDLHNCVGTLARELTVNTYKDLMRNPAAGPVSKTGQKCSGSLFKGIGKYVDTSLKSTGKCQSTIEKNDVKAGAATNGYQCTDDDTKAKVSGALTKLFNILPSAPKPKCSAADLVELGVAGETEANFKRRIATTGPLDIFAQNPVGLARSLAEGVGQQVWEGGQCPVSTQIRIVSRNEGKGFTNLDVGFTGAGHGFDLPSNFLGHVGLDFSGDPTCSAGTITVSPFFEGNRCLNDNTVTCDEPFALDSDDCSGNLCQPHFGPPLALNASNTPTCTDNVLQSVLGTANAGTGESSTLVTQRSVVSTGNPQTTPCAYCSGDTTANDGVRNGLCVQGPDAGNPCDANSAGGTFPASSYDCRGGGTNVSGPGLQIALNLTTGAQTLSDTATTGAAACGPGGVLDCHCATCTGDATVPCNTDADCATAGGTCSSDGNGTSRFPNQCSDDGFVCSDTGDGIHGECASSRNFFCDGITKVDGTGFLVCSGGSCSTTTSQSCVANSECPSGETCDLTNGNLDCAAITGAGQCTLASQRPCFLPDIQVSGHPSQDTTTVASNFCIAGIGGAGAVVDTAAGLAGPARVAIDFELNPFCDSPPTKAFVGNGGNCNRP